MLAETHGKLSSGSNQEFERMEDLLTDYVFGSLKYLDRRYLHRVLAAAIGDVPWDQSDVDTAAFRFWPQLPGGTEPDVMMTIRRELVIIEAKLHSGFGVGSDELDDQLVREWRHGRRWGEPRKLHGPSVVTVTATYSEPAEVAAANELIEAEYGVADAVSWISWQRIARLLEDPMEDVSRGDRLMIDDLLKVMERKGVRRVFGGFNQEDYWVVAAGNRIAADRIYPAIATFAAELYELCEGSGVVRGIREMKIVSTGSASLSRPHLWGATQINVPLWVESWPPRKTAPHALLFVQFPLTEPVMRVGYRIRVNARRKDEWRNYVPDLVSGLADAHGYEVVVVSYPDLNTVEQRIDATDLTEAWMNGVIDNAEKYVSIQRTFPLDDLTQTAMVRDMLIQDVALLDNKVPMLVAEAAEA